MGSKQIMSKKERKEIVKRWKNVPYLNKIYFQSLWTIWDAQEGIVRYPTNKKVNKKVRRKTPKYEPIHEVHETG